MDFLATKLMNLNYQKIPFLKIARKKGYISKGDELKLNKIDPYIKFIPARKNIFDYLLLNNFFIYKIRFNPLFQKFFNKGFIPWFLFKLKVRQDVYIDEDRDIKKLYLKAGISEKEKQEVNRCLKEYCPMNCKSLYDKRCIKCMYCYQILPELIGYEGNLGAFKMQMERFGVFIKKLNRENR